MAEAMHAMKPRGEVGPSPTRSLAAFGRDLSYDAIPANVLQKAKEVIIDTVDVDRLHRLADCKDVDVLVTG